jgi:hypothetical protein
VSAALESADAGLFGLLTGRQLVKALERLGLGERTPDAVRQWIREEPPCPIAEHATSMGKGHRYLVMDVLDWLLVRAQAERGKTYTSADGRTAIDMVSGARLLAAQLRAQVGGDSLAPSMPPAAAAAPLPILPPAPSLPLTLGAEAPGISQAKSDPLESGHRDPRHVLAAEQAKLTRLKVERELGKVIPVEDLERALEAQASTFRTAVDIARAQIKIALADCGRDDERQAVVDRQFDEMLSQLAEAKDLPAVDALGVPED